MDRRKFLKFIGVGSAAAVVPLKSGLPMPPQAEIVMTSIDLTIDAFAEKINYPTTGTFQNTVITPDEITRQALKMLEHKCMRRKDGRSD